MSVNLFVIIVTYKGRQWYDRCFGSLRESTIPVQTIVVDNASNDGTVEYIREQYPEILLIEPKENLGFGRANNIAMRYAMDHGCDYVFLLNQDAWVEPDTFEKLVDIHQRHKEYGLLGPVQVNAEKTKVLKGVVKFLVNPGKVNLGLFSDLIMGEVDEVYPVAEINAAAWLLPRATIETVGGFDPLFLHYGEDWNYLSRVLYHKMKVGLTPSLKVVHDCKDRVEQPKGYAMNFDKWLLQRASDILYPDSQVDDLIRYYRRMAIIKLLTFHKATFRENWEAFRYLREHKDSIVQSRKQNKKKGANWL
jgi:GT2 family glycosyltransferase